MCNSVRLDAVEATSIKRSSSSDMLWMTMKAAPALAAGLEARAYGSLIMISPANTLAGNTASTAAQRVILKDIKDKCMDSVAAARRVPSGSRGRTAPKLDTYVAKNLVQQLRAQYAHVAGDLANVEGRLQGYLADYRTEFKEEYTHGGRPFVLREQRGQHDLDAFLPPEFLGGSE